MRQAGKLVRPRRLLWEKRKKPRPLPTISKSFTPSCPSNNFSPSTPLWLDDHDDQNTTKFSTFDYPMLRDNARSPYPGLGSIQPQLSAEDSFHCNWSETAIQTPESKTFEHSLPADPQIVLPRLFTTRQRSAKTQACTAKLSLTLITSTRSPSLALIDNNQSSKSRSGVHQHANFNRKLECIPLQAER